MRDGPINPIQTEILNYLVSYPESTAYSICRDHSWVMQSPIIRSKNVNDRTLRRDIAALERKGFIQRFQKGKYEHKAQPSRLTLSGIVFLVLKKRLMHGKTFCKVFENYGNNTLFQVFLYPYIKQETLLRLTTLNTALPVSLFLQEVCGHIKDALYIINTSGTKYLAEQVFVWELGSLNDYAKNSLREFLKQKFDLPWLDRAEFSKIENDNTLKISRKTNTILIKMDHKLGKAILKMKGKERYRFTVRPYRGYSYLIEAPSATTHEENAANLLFSTVQNLVPSLVFNLTSSVFAGFKDSQPLSQDKVLCIDWKIQRRNSLGNTKC